MVKEYGEMENPEHSQIALFATLVNVQMPST